MSTFIDENSLIKFYYYYLSFTLAFSWTLFPLLFWTILTQSKNLTSFKWLIINHSIWCLSLQTSTGLIKPYFLLPASAGIQIGIFRNISNSNGTAIATLFVTSFTMNSILGLVLTLGNRYIGTFDSNLIKYFYTKKCYFFIFFFHVLSHFFVFLTLIPVMSINDSMIIQWALDYDPLLEKYFSEPSFFMLSHAYHDYPDLIGIGFIIFLIAFFGFVIIYFKIQIKANQNLLKNKLQISLIFSSIAQISVTCIFLLIPVLCLLIFIRFDISQSRIIMNILLCVFLSHCWIDFISTLYFVTPYRKYISKFISRNFLFKKRNKQCIEAKEEA